MQRCICRWVIRQAR